jgi:hypothetical protein
MKTDDSISSGARQGNRNILWKKHHHGGLSRGWKSAPGVFPRLGNGAALAAQIIRG